MSYRSGQHNVPRETSPSEVATPEGLLDQLKRLYWGGAHREICSMIMAFREISAHHPNALAGEEDKELLDGENYGKIFELWCEEP